MGSVASQESGGRPDSSASGAAGVSVAAVATYGPAVSHDPDDAKAILSRHHAPPWFEDAKLGIFVHWGLYSVPGWAPTLDGDGPAFTQIVDAMANGTIPYAEWYLNSMRTPGSATEAYHREHHGDAPYEDFREPFTAMLDDWDPGAWADTFAAAGARYVVLTTKHSDGYLLWPSAHRHPFKDDWQTERDVVGELADAVRARGMRFGIYYCGGLDWSFVTRPITDLASVYSTVPTDPVYRAYAEAHVRELIDRYEPSVLWNDISLPPEFARDEILVEYLDRVPDGVINDRMRVVPNRIAKVLDTRPGRSVANFLGRKVSAGGGMVQSVPYFADYATPEYTAESEIRAHKWETCRGFGHSFGYNRVETDDDIIDVTEVIRSFVDTVAKNGNLLLNVGPTGEDGTIPELQTARLAALGEWLDGNGEAVTGTRPWTRAEATTDAGLEVRFTQADGALYATIFGDPTPGPVVIAGVAPQGPVELLGHGPLERQSTTSGLGVVWPVGVSSAVAHVLRIGDRV